MDTVVLDGVEYVKASVLAKQFRYTPDYLGQLCRAKKIDARLVGRTWFVNPDSVKEHRLKKKQKPKKQTTKNQESELASKTKPKRKIVLPVVQNKTVKATNDLPLKIAGVETRKLKVAYEKDDENLIPKLTKKKTRPPKTIRIEHANAKKIKVSNKKKKEETSFKPEKLPDVALSGKLKITTAPDPEPEPSPEEESVDTKTSFEKRLISANQDIPGDTKPPIDKEAKDKKKPTKPLKPKMVKVKVGKPESTKEVKLTSDSQDVVSVPLKPASEVLEKVSTEVSDLPPVQTEVKTPTVILMSPLIASIVALVVVLLIFSASTSIVVFDSGNESKVILQIANLLDILRQ